jgi:hypothetical protein
MSAWRCLTSPYVSQIMSPVFQTTLNRASTPVPESTRNETLMLLTADVDSLCLKPGNCVSCRRKKRLLSFGMKGIVDSLLFNPPRRSSWYVAPGSNTLMRDNVSWTMQPSVVWGCAVGLAVREKWIYWAGNNSISEDVYILESIDPFPEVHTCSWSSSSLSSSQLSGTGNRLDGFLEGAPVCQWCYFNIKHKEEANWSCWLSFAEVIAIDHNKHIVQFMFFVGKHYVNY